MITDKIPAWVLRSALLVVLPISAAALYLTRSYAVGNLIVLGLDADTIFVRRLSIDVLLAAHVAAFFLIALLPDRIFRFRRQQLRILAIAIWLFDGAAIYQARFGLMDSADTAQVSAVTRLADQRASIKGLQAQASAMRVTADRQMNNKMITKGAESQAEAARLEAEAAAMTKQLASMPSGAGTTEVKTWGALAPYKAATESALISFVSLIMLGLSGLAVRGLLELSAARSVPVKSADDAPALAPAKPAPGVVMQALRWLGVLVGGGAAVAAPAHSAPAESSQPAAPSIPSNSTELKNTPGAPACTPADADALMSTPAAPVKPASAPDAPVPKPAPVEPAALAPSAPAQVQDAASAEPDAPGKVQAQSARRKLPDGVREAVRSRLVKPTQAGLKSMGVGQGYAAEWLAQMGAEGILKSNGKGGWVLNEDNV